MFINKAMLKDMNLKLNFWNIASKVMGVPISGILRFPAWEL
jgi:hypothetical protein